MKYANGLLFSSTMEHVAVIEKSRPARFAGKLFPGGGHVEMGESPAEAMAREGEEELGVLIAPEDWTPIAITKTTDNGELMATFFAVSDRVFDARTCSEETVHVMKTSDLVLQCLQKPDTVATDLLTFIALAQHAHAKPQQVAHFDRWTEVDPNPEDGIFSKTKRTSLKP